jgi:aryl-alcohol dehydrogenase-like predicted oxidoreductase
LDYIRLGSTPLQVSRICLGTVFRTEQNEAACRAALAQAFDLGINFVDCANVYRGGLAEEFVGRAVQTRRQSVVISTKVGAAVADDPGCSGLSRAAVLRSAEASLTRLGTDYLDCLLCHFPDPATPLTETLGALGDLVQQGKIRYAGCSNFEAWRLAEALALAPSCGLNALVCHQVLYSLLDRSVEVEGLPLCRRHGVGVTAYATTAIGLLSGRYRRGQSPPQGSSWQRGPYNYRAAMTVAVDGVIAALLEVAGDTGRTPSQVAMAWCLRPGGADVVIIGADTAERVRENCGAAGWQLTMQERARLEHAARGVRLEVRKDCPQGYQPEPGDAGCVTSL